MFKKIWQAIRSLFGRLRKRHTEEPNLTDTRSDNDNGNYPADGQPSVEEESGGRATESGIIAQETFSYPSRRLFLLTSKLKPYHNRNREIRAMRVEQFTDAYRFMLLLCGGATVSAGHKGGHLCYNAGLPGMGVLELVEKSSAVSRDTVAVLTFSTVVPGIGIKEIKFIRNKHSRKK